MSQSTQNSFHTAIGSQNLSDFDQPSTESIKISGVQIINDPECIIFFNTVYLEAARQALEDVNRKKINTLHFIYLKDEHRYQQNQQNQQRYQQRVQTFEPLHKPFHGNIRPCIAYDSSHIITIGGSALSLYNIFLSQFKDRHHINEISDFMGKDTSDMDMIWWPFRSDAIYVSTSPYIVELATSVAGKLQQQMDSRNENLTTLLNRVLKMKNTYECECIMTPMHHIGTLHVELFLKINGQKMDKSICDLSIHDSSCSQQYNMMFQTYQTVGPMTNDIYYITLQDYINIGNFGNIPRIDAFVQQQLFTFGTIMNRIATNPDKIHEKARKAMICYLRVEFVQRLLLSVQFDNPNNMRNVENIFMIDRMYLVSFIKRILYDKQYTIVSLLKNIKYVHGLVSADPELRSFYGRISGISSASAANASVAANSSIRAVPHIINIDQEKIEIQDLIKGDKPLIKKLVPNLTRGKNDNFYNTLSQPSFLSNNLTRNRVDGYITQSTDIIKIISETALTDEEKQQLNALTTKIREHLLKIQSTFPKKGGLRKTRIKKNKRTCKTKKRTIR